MASITIEDLTEKLNFVPQFVLDKVNGYIDSLLQNSEDQNKIIVLTDDQIKILKDQIDSDKSEYVDADVFYNSLRVKYEL